MVLSLLISFIVGFIIGAHHARLWDKITELRVMVEAIEDSKHTKTSGVVRPRLAGALVPIDTPGDERKSSVVRPRMPQTGDEDRQATLSTVRKRVQ